MSIPKPQLSSLRLLILTPSTSQSSTNSSTSPFPSFLEATTGSKPLTDISTFAGYTSHSPLRLKTRYYEADVSIWCDELPLPSATSQDKGDKTTTPRSNTVTEDDSVHTLEDWKEQMLSSEASEVRAVIGGLILLLPVSTSFSSEISKQYLDLIETVHALREAIEDETYGRDIAAVVVLQSASPKHVTQKELDGITEKLEDQVLQERGVLGWDFVTWDGVLQDVRRADEDEEVEKNEFGEKLGVERVLEVLEGIDWTTKPPDEDNVDDLDDSMDFLTKNRFKGLDDELQQEMMGLKLSMLDQKPSDQFNNIPPVEDPDGEDISMDQMQALMDRVVSIRVAGAEMSKEEREKFAKREVNRMMKELG